MRLLSVDFWRENTNYVSNNRFKSFIVYNDILYICNTTHLSGETFDMSKFTAIGGGAGGLSVQGDWDIAESTSLGPVTELSLGFDTAYDASFLTPLNIFGNVSGTPLYPFGSGYRIFGASSPVITKTAGTKWVDIDTDSSIVYTFIMVYEDTYVDPINDLIIPSLGSPNSQDNYASMHIVKIPGNNGVSVITNNVAESFSGVTMSDSTTTVSIGFDLLAGTISVRIGSDIDTKNITINGTNHKIGIFSIFGSFFSNSNIVISNGVPEFTYTGQETIVVPPIGANDGSAYHITSDGVYDNKSVSYGDYAIFYDNVDKILPIKNYDGEILSLSNNVTALDAFVTANTPSLLEYVSRRGVIDYIGEIEPVSPTYGKTWIDRVFNANELKAFDGDSWIVLEPMQFQRFVYGDTGLELFYNKLNYVTRRGTNTPDAETNMEYYSLLNNSNDKWCVSEDKSCDYISLIETSNADLILNAYKDVIIDCSDSILPEYNVFINGAQVFESDTSYIKEHTIQLYGGSDVKVNFYQTNIVGLNSSIVNVNANATVLLKLYQTPNMNFVHYVSGLSKVGYFTISNLSPNFFIGNYDEIYVTVDSDTAFNFVTKLSASEMKKFIINFKNTATTPDVSLVISNDVGNPDLVIPLPIGGASGVLTILTNGNIYEVF